MCSTATSWKTSSVLSRFVLWKYEQTNAQGYRVLAKLNWTKSINLYAVIIITQVTISE